MIGWRILGSVGGGSSTALQGVRGDGLSTPAMCLPQFDVPLRFVGSYQQAQTRHAGSVLDAPQRDCVCGYRVVTDWPAFCAWLSSGAPSDARFLVGRVVALGGSYPGRFDDPPSAIRVQRFRLLDVLISPGVEARALARRYPTVAIITSPE